MELIQKQADVRRCTIPFSFFNSRVGLTLVVSLWCLLLLNAPFWSALWHAAGVTHGGSLLFVLSVPVFALAWIYVLLSLLAWGPFTKPVLGIVLFLSAFCSYFQYTYGTLIDRTMVTNLVQTDLAEVRDLLSWRLFFWVLVLGILPLIVLARFPLVTRPWKSELGIKLASMLLALLCFSGVVLTQYQSYASLVRNHRELRHMFTPSNWIGALQGYVRHSSAEPVALQPIGEDAHQAVKVGAVQHPRVLLLVVGETARADHFSLNGYGRPTNPELEKLNVVNFPSVSSCGTATAVSLPCMFLDVGRSDYQDGLIQRRENLLDVLQHAGVQVVWRDNNSGCKGVCDRVQYQDVSNLKIADLCNDEECYDEVLLYGLQEQLSQIQKDTVIVLHMKGSHGPAYFKRYPQSFKNFTPVCESNELNRCSPETIGNAYDNTLRYTDHVLAKAIRLLQAQSAHVDGSLLYMSDHGESLGEHGLYLHGVPYAFAPREQTHIPMVLWVSSQTVAHAGLDEVCLDQERSKEYSHDNLFHSVLGMMDVQTSVYQANKDFFSPCRSNTKNIVMNPGSSAVVN